jgi:hypothetical protein
METKQKVIDSVITFIVGSGGGGSSNTIVGQLYPTDYTVSGSGANDVVATRYYCAYTTTVTKMYLGVSTNSSSQHIILGIYNSLNPTTTGDRPTGWPIDSTASTTMSGNTDQPVIISLASSITLTAGNYYWFAYISDQNNTLEECTSGSFVYNCQYFSQIYNYGWLNISSLGTASPGFVIAAYQ